MGLFEGIRSRTNSVPAQLFFALVVLVFVFWGVGGNSGPQTTTYATVNGERINNADVQRVARHKNQRQEQNKDEQDRVVQEIIEQMIRAESLMQTARKEGLRSSDYELASQLASDPTFRENDEFSQTRYIEIINNMGFSNEVKYENLLNETIMADKLLANVAHSAFLSKAALKNMHTYFNTTKEVHWVRLSEGIFFEEVEIEESRILEIISQQEARLNEQYLADLNTKYARPDTWTYTQVTIDEAWKINELEAPSTDLLSTAQQTLPNEKIDTLLQKPPFQGYLVQSSSISNSEAQFAPEVFSLIQPLENGQAVLSTDKNTLYVLKKKTPAFEQSFAEVKKDLALEFAREEAAAKNAEDFAKKLVTEWTEEVPQILLDSKTLSIEKSGPFIQSSMPQALQAISTATDLMAFIQKSTTTGTIPQPYKIPEGWVVARIEKITPPEEGSLFTNEDIYKFQLQQNLLMKYVDEVQQKASVQRLYKPLQ
jgi:hypothetical protein